MLRYQILFTIYFNQVCIFLIQNNIELPLVRLFPNNPIITHGFHDDFLIFVHPARQEFQNAVVYYKQSQTVRNYLQQSSEKSRESRTSDPKLWA